MRKAEILKLRWEQVDLGAGHIRLEAEDTKTKQARLIVLTERVKRRSVPSPVADSPGSVPKPDPCRGGGRRYSSGVHGALRIVRTSTRQASQTA